MFSINIKKIYIICYELCNFHIPRISSRYLRAEKSEDTDKDTEISSYLDVK